MSQSEAFIENRSRGRGDTTRDSSGSTHENHDAPRLEPWLVVALLAIIPMLVAFAIPKTHVVFAAAISGILLVVGLAMLVVQERKRG